MKKILGLGLVFVAGMMISSIEVRAADSGIYNPSYRYTGPRSQNVGEEEIEGKDPLLATVFSVLPGVLVHGFGNFYAENYDFATRMLTTEIFGAGLAFWGHDMSHNPDRYQHYFGGNDNTEMAGFWVKAAGMGLIFLSWVGDVATASHAADSYNKDHQIQFQLESFNGTGLQLSLVANF